MKQDSPVQRATMEDNNEDITKGMSELQVSGVHLGLTLLIFLTQSWQWKYGQTPEFTYDVQNTFEWGTVVSPNLFICCSILKAKLQEAKIRSKHGVVLSCQIQGFDDLGKTFEGERYGESGATRLGGDKKDDDVRKWLLDIMMN